jgi:hypothetical protein
MNVHFENSDSTQTKTEPLGNQAHQRASQLASFRLCLKRSAMSQESFISALTQTALVRLETWSLPDLERLLTTSLRYGLSPTGREIFMLPDPMAEAPLIVVGVDGWSRILNEHKKFAGMRFNESKEFVDGVPAWIECTIHRWDRGAPTSVREYLCEVRGLSQAWITHPRRMLRHKAMVQCARISFGMGDVFDPDEAQKITSAKEVDASSNKSDLPKRISTNNKRGPLDAKGLRSRLGMSS